MNELRGDDFIKIWVDDVRPAPEGYHWCQSVNETKGFIEGCMKWNGTIELLDLDHDSGDYVSDGGDYIEILNWLEEYMICYFPIRIHSMNPVGVENMRRIIKRNGWTEI